MAKQCGVMYVLHHQVTFYVHTLQYYKPESGHIQTFLLSTSKPFGLNIIGNHISTRRTGFSWVVIISCIKKAHGTIYYILTVVELQYPPPEYCVHHSTIRYEQKRIVIDSRWRFCAVKLNWKINICIPVELRHSTRYILTLPVALSRRLIIVALYTSVHPQFIRRLLELNIVLASLVWLFLNCILFVGGHIVFSCASLRVNISKAEFSAVIWCDLTLNWNKRNFNLVFRSRLRSPWPIVTWEKFSKL